MKPRIDRSAIVSRIRLRHVSRAISAAHFGDASGWSALEGDLTAGRYLCGDGSGNHHVFAWSPAGVVALIFDHESPMSEAALPAERRRREELFVRAPERVGGLVAQVCARGDRLGTAALWVVGSGRNLDASEVGETAQVRGYLGTAVEAMRGGSGIPGWRQLDSISTAQSRLAVALAGEEWRSGGRLLSDDEAREILAPPRAVGRYPRRENAAAAAALLAQAGFSWLDAADVAERLQLAADSQASIDPGVALLKAAHRGDVETVERLLDAGANIETRSRMKDLPDAPFGRLTPLLVATYERHWEVAHLLLRRGADPNARVHGITPLGNAARRGNLELCRALLECGARTSYDHPYTLLHAAFHGQSIDALRLLLEAGAPVPEHGHGESLARFADENGAPDLAARLRAANVDP